jgi:transcriptional regulator with PAS, ATPase and Fis domain
MTSEQWTNEFNAAITRCDENGIILEMNDKALLTFQKDGGRALIGKSLYDCHPEPARTKLRELMASQGTNCYTIEKNGVHKLIYQAPWYSDGKCRGLVEISFEIPSPMPHFVRS